MGMPTMEVCEEEKPWILSKPALITVAVQRCLQNDTSKVSYKVKYATFYGLKAALKQQLPWEIKVLTCNVDNFLKNGFLSNSSVHLIKLYHVLVWKWYLLHHNLTTIMPVLQVFQKQLFI